MVYETDELKEKELVNRLNRVSGQVNAIKKSISRDDSFHCKQTLQLLKASINALKKFGEAYVEYKMDTCLDAMPPRKVKEQLKEIIASAFSL